jgi:hypothetical protein
MDVPFVEEVDRPRERRRGHDSVLRVEGLAEIRDAVVVVELVPGQEVA